MTSKHLGGLRNTNENKIRGSHSNLPYTTQNVNKKKAKNLKSQLKVENKPFEYHGNERMNTDPDIRSTKNKRKNYDNSALSFVSNSNNNNHIIIEQPISLEDDDIQKLGKLSLINASARFQLLSAN